MGSRNKLSLCYKLNQLITVTLLSSFRLLDFVYLYKLHQGVFPVAKCLLSPNMMKNSTLTSKLISKDLFLNCRKDKEMDTATKQEVLMSV